MYVEQATTSKSSVKLAEEYATNGMGVVCGGERSMASRLEPKPLYLQIT